MDNIYQGDMRLARIAARLELTPDRGELEIEYDLENRGSAPLRHELTTGGRELRRFDLRQPGSARLARGPGPHPTVEQRRQISLSPRERIILDEDSVVPLPSSPASPSFIFRPILLADGRQVLGRVEAYDVTVALPQSARKLIYASVPPAAIRSTPAGLVCEFRQANVYALPISIKWTESDADVAISRTARILPGNVVQVTIRLTNRGGSAVSKLLVEDDYSAADATPAEAGGLLVVAETDKDPRLIFRQEVSLSPHGSATLSYSIRSRTIQLRLPRTRAMLNGALVAVSTDEPDLNFALPPPAPRAAFAIPAGWSFDFTSGDHHLNEHGVWCSEQVHDHARERLAWMTGCIYADSNFDDDYRWSVAHQVIRCTPGFAHPVSSGWLSKTGATSSHTNSFQHATLKQFTDAVVLLSGWRFDFTSGDHHINKIALSLEQVAFDRGAGRVDWRARGTYIDKNHDDGYRWQYWCTILGFNGWHTLASFSGSRARGSAAHAGEVIDPELRNYGKVLVIPVGWSFDYAEADHHINENGFRIQNIAFDPAAGKATWTAHLHYCDKNRDDPFSWEYRVVVIGTNDADCAEVMHGPIRDNGGLAVASLNVALADLMRPITWTNGMMDGDETGVDCGGSSPARPMNCLGTVNPGNGANADLFSLRLVDDLSTVRAYANYALLEYALENGADPATFYTGVTKADRYVEAIAAYVAKHMDYVADRRGWNGAQSAVRTLTESGYRGANDFAGDCEDHAVLRAALLRSLGFSPTCIFCADHHNDYNQGQDQECSGDKKGGGHAFNVVVYKGKYRILDYGRMQDRYWANRSCWNQHAVDNIWNDRVGEHWDRKDVTPFGSTPLVNYPGNPSSPSCNWDWRTYFCDITA